MRTSRSRLRLASLGLAIAAAVAPATSALQPTAAIAQDLDTVVEQREGVESDLAAAEAEFDRLWTEVDRVEAELAGMQARVAELEEQAAQLEESLAARARSLYMHGEPPLINVLTAGSPSEAVRLAGTLAAVQRRESSQLESAVAIRTQLDQARALLDARQSEFAELLAQAEAATAALTGELDDLVLLETDLRAREARKQELLQGLLNGTYSCIFEPSRTHFRDTWGAPRGGGTRRHKGTDVFAAYGEPVFAITDGVIKRLNNSRIGGISVYLSGDDGHLYYYTHLSGYANGLYTGKRVEAGEMIAFNGDSGNARGGAPHVHFQFHPYGGAPVNPYSTLATLCFGR